MPSVVEHYENHLAPVYLWMAGGAEAAFSAGQADLEPVLRGTGFAIDLGAGFGMHAVPLARAGWRVLAVDSSPALLQQLSTFADGLSITAHRGDLLRFEEHLSAADCADLILCMGDTLTHLETPDAIATLSHTVAARLSSGGRFIATFRDYTRLPAGDARFIPVRADEHRILTCFLEEVGTTFRCTICCMSARAVGGVPESAAIANSACRPRQSARPLWTPACKPSSNPVHGEW